MRITFSPIVIVPFLLATATAIARGDWTHESVGGGLSLEIIDNGLFVSKGKQRARLGRATALTRVTIDKAQRKVDAEVEDFTPAGNSHLTYTLAHLEARLENSAAYALYKKKDFAGAAVGFQRALKLDPTWGVALFNYASAAQLAGDAAAAIRALGPFLVSSPVETYVHVATDPDLAPLLGRPELVAVRAPKAGAITLTPREADVVVGFSPDKNLVALVRKEQSWGSCDYDVTLELHDGGSGKRVATAKLINANEVAEECEGPTAGMLPTARVAIAKRARLLSEMLSALGFLRPASLEQAVEKDYTDGKLKLAFAKAKLGLVVTDDVARVLRKDDVLGSAPMDKKVSGAVYVGDAKVVVVWSGRSGAECCEETDPTYATVIPVAVR